MAQIETNDKDLFNIFTQEFASRCTVFIYAPSIASKLVANVPSLS